MDKVRYRYFLRRFYCAVIPLLLLIGVTRLTATDTVPIVKATRIEGKIRIDGVLDEPAWRNAGVIPDLIQQEPIPGKPTRFKTKVL